MRRVLLLAVLAALALPSPAAAVLLGLEGNKNRFRDQTGQQTQIHLFFTGWGKNVDQPGQMDTQLESHGPIPMLAFGTRKADGSEGPTPRAIAQGRGDRYLIALSESLGRWGRAVYVRPMAEMNGHWNFYCAYNANGTYRGDAYSLANFRKAFRRIYLIMHGGTRSDVNAQLDALGMPRLNSSSDLPLNSLVRVVWNPQGFGSPDIPKNSANSYYPGDGYVDVVANDIYDIRFNPQWEANTRLFKSHPSKPYAIGEWGLWGIDDPAFVRRMASFVSNHPRVEFITYYRSAKGSIFDLGSKPSSRAAYRRQIVPLAE
jgi:hypothetical protein